MKIEFLKIRRQQVASLLCNCYKKIGEKSIIGNEARHTQVNVSECASLFHCFSSLESCSSL